MNVILFQNQFEEAIVAGVKDCTIRAPRKDGRARAVVGETVSLRVWSGAPYRSKQREISQRVVKHCFPVLVTPFGIQHQKMPSHWQRDGGEFSKQLGFSCWSAAAVWYEQQHGLPFEGVLVHFPKIV